MIDPELESETAVRWREDAARTTTAPALRLRLAAMAGHMTTDRRAARRGALIDVLADGRPHTGPAIRERLAAELGGDCWGARPDEALLRDMAALRRGGVRVAYSRRKGTEGYYLRYPSLGGWPAAEQPAIAGGPDSRWLEHIRALAVPQKNEVAFAAAEFALRQKRLILAEQQPDLPAEAIDRQARRLVFGVEPVVRTTH